MSTLCRLLSLATVRDSRSLVSASSGMKSDIWELWELLGKQQAEVRAEFKDWMSRAEDCVPEESESNPLGSWEHAACCVEDVHIHMFTSHLNWDFTLTYAVLNTNKWKSPKWKCCPYRFHSVFTRFRHVDQQKAVWFESGFIHHYTFDNRWWTYLSILIPSQCLHLN